MKVFYVGSDDEEHVLTVNANFTSYKVRTILKNAALDGVLRVDDNYIPWHRVVRVEK